MDKYIKELEKLLTSKWEYLIIIDNKIRFGKIGIQGQQCDMNEETMKSIQSYCKENNLLISDKTIKEVK